MEMMKEQEISKKLDVGLWRKLFKYISVFKKELICLWVVNICVAGVDVIMPIINKIIIDDYIGQGRTEGLWKVGVVFIVVVIFQCIFVKLMMKYAGGIDTGLSYHIRKLGFNKLQELSFSYYDKTPLGWIMARMTSDVYRLSEILSWGLMDIVWGLFMMVGFIAVMLYNNWRLTFVTLAIVPVLFVIGIYFQKKILKAHREARKFNSQITGDFNECITGAKTTKTLVREEANLEEFKHDTGNMRRYSIRAAIYSSLFMPIVLTCGSIGTGLALWQGGELVMFENSGMTLGLLVMFINYTVMFFEPVAQIANVLAELKQAQASAERTITLIEMEPDIQDSKEILDVYGDMLHPKKENWPKVSGKIKFKNVSFKYKNGETVLKNFNLDIKAGETIALVGETGSGKSTIVNLACRFYEPTEGEILIDGVDYRKRSIAWLQSNLGYVLQSPHLFSGTIKENIRYGNLDATEDEIIDAAKLVNAHEFISKLPDGYDSHVGEGGGKLSTGEKQLISFARAIVSNPSIFVLDEATSSIDTETERVIQQAIEKVLKGRTSFVIAHRLSTIVSADKILVIRNGKIQEEGNHKQLMAKKGYYYNLYTNQFIEDREKEILGDKKEVMA